MAVKVGMYNKKTKTQPFFVQNKRFGKTKKLGSNLSLHSNIKKTVSIKDTAFLMAESTGFLQLSNINNCFIVINTLSIIVYFLTFIYYIAPLFKSKFKCATD